MGGWWAAGVEPLPPTPPVLRVLTLTRLDLTRYNDDNDMMICTSYFTVRQILFEMLVDLLIVVSTVACWLRLANSSVCLFVPPFPPY